MLGRAANPVRSPRLLTPHASAPALRARMTARVLPVCALVLALWAQSAHGQGQALGTAISYQGRITIAGAPPTGSYDLQFRLFDALSGGVQLGSTAELLGQSVTGGLFTVSLDFGNQFSSGFQRWLEISVRPAGGASFTTLAPRQRMSAAPQAQGLPLPLSLVATSASRVLEVHNNGTGYGIMTQSLGTIALRAESAAASGSAVFGLGGGSNSTGIHGSGSANGVYGESFAGTGVLGEHQLASGTSPGVQGNTISQSNNAAGVVGRVATTAATSGSAGVRGINQGTGSGGVGVWGSHAGSGWGVYGSTSGPGNGVVGDSVGGIGVWGTATGGGLAGKFSGNLQVTGTLSKGGGSFKIDHPLDPANKYLYHSFVESPDMMNVYNGNITTDNSGYATVILPDWFEALNRDFRYQLTVVDEGDSAAFSQAKIVSGVKGNRFTLRTSAPHVTVSWQVTGIRQDRWANAHRIPVEQDKATRERGLYLHPELLGLDASAALDTLIPRAVAPGEDR
jgi:hypothetical protein